MYFKGGQGVFLADWTEKLRASSGFEIFGYSYSRLNRQT
jgi:hypothetical protein